MKGLQSLFLGIFGIFGFSWLGLVLIPQLQIGSLNPQTDEDGTDVYPMPASGMAQHGAKVYAANGCFYCHTQQVRPDYGGSDLERKWGDRRSAPRDYIFEPLVMLGKMRNGPDLANVGHRPALEEKGAATPPPAGSPATSPAAGASPATAAAPAASPTSVGTPVVGAGPSSAASPSSNVAATTPGAPATLPAAGNLPAATVPTSAPAMVADVKQLTADGRPLPYTAAWHHRHLYDPRSISQDSNMPSYRFLYKKRRIGGTASPESLNFVGIENEAPEQGWEIVPSYDAECLVAYLMSRNQSHPLQEARSVAVAATAPSPAKEGGAK